MLVGNYWVSHQPTEIEDSKASNNNYYPRTYGVSNSDANKTPKGSIINNEVKKYKASSSKRVDYNMVGWSQQEITE